MEEDKQLVTIKYTEEQFSDLQESLRLLESLTLENIKQKRNEIVGIENSINKLVESRDKIRGLIINNEDYYENRT